MGGRHYKVGRGTILGDNLDRTFCRFNRMTWDLALSFNQNLGIGPGSEMTAA